MMDINEILFFGKGLHLDDHEMQLLMHYTRLPIETLKRRYPRARSDTSKLFITTAINYKEAEKLNLSKQVRETQ